MRELIRELSPEESKILKLESDFATRLENNALRRLELAEESNYSTRAHSATLRDLD